MAADGVACTLHAVDRKAPNFPAEPLRPTTLRIPEGEVAKVLAVVHKTHRAVLYCVVVAADRRAKRNDAERDPRLAAHSEHSNGRRSVRSDPFLRWASALGK